jgi:hypothetical protein
MKRLFARALIVGPLLALYILGFFYTPNQAHSETWGLPWSAAITLIVLVSGAIVGVVAWALSHWKD